MNPNDTAAFVTLVLTVGVVAFTWIATRARRQPSVGSAELKAIDERLARMEQAIDAMAVETERISEGQRFASKLLSERAQERVPRN